MSLLYGRCPSEQTVTAPHHVRSIDVFEHVNEHDILIGASVSSENISVSPVRRLSRIPGTLPPARTYTISRVRTSIADVIT